MKKYKLLLLPLIFALIFVSCEDKSDLTAPGPVNTGDADFSRFYAIGNSLTAGYQSSSLYESAQKYSFGKQIANQVNATFEQPTVADPGIGGRIDVLTVSPFVTTTQPEAGGLPTNSTYAGTYNNMGIPGIVVGDALLTTSSPSPISGDNPLIDVVLRGQGTVLEQVLRETPTFISSSS